MKGTPLALLATLVLGTAATLIAPYRAITPGALAAGHERLGNDCLACHVVLSGPSREKCLACHPLDAIGLRLVDGKPRQPERPRSNLVHRALAGGDCSRCHVAHRGAPGATPPLHFSHLALSAELRPQCLTCHATDRPADALHANPTGTCSACHSSERWKPASFEHARYFRFDSHHPSRCRDCHQLPDYRVYTCYSCHEHTPAKMAEEHRKLRVQDLDRCARCHPSGNEHDVRGGESGGRGEDRGGDEKDDD
jgi:hypothetical protein